MKTYQHLGGVALMLLSSAAWAYGSGGGSSKACETPTFSDFIPKEKTTVAAGSGFSFTASAETFPKSIKVTVKGSPVTVKVTPDKAGGYQVSGTLPASINGYARIVISADGQNSCPGEGGWLIKIAQ